jgi:hypothetical protein
VVMRFTHSPPKGCTMTKRDATPAGVDFKALLEAIRPARDLSDFGRVGGRSPSAVGSLD